MPVEIKELIIRAVAMDAREEEPGPSRSAPVADADKEALIAACVKQVLQILKRSRER